MHLIIPLILIAIPAIIVHMSWIRMFQIKEYRFDRLQSHLLESGWDFIRANAFKPPAKTPRNTLLSALALVTHFLLLLITLQPILRFTVIGTLVALIVTYPIGVASAAIAVALTSPLSTIRRRSLIQRAKKSLSDKPVSVTLLSGSYGKSSVKEFVAAISQSQFDTAKTRSNMNTDVGVAVCVLDSITPHTKHFIAEVGGYQIGEVRDAAAVVADHIDCAIITAFGNQHVSLYGSRDNLIRAESEVISFLGSDSACYINLSAYNEPIFQSEILPNAKCRFVTYSTEPNTKATITVRNIHATAEGTSATVQYDTHRLAIHTHLLGNHSIENLLPVVGWGIDHAIDEKTISQTITTIQPITHKLSVHRGVGECVVLDDSGNSSLHGFLAAIDVMQLFPKKNKIIIGPGIIELGSEKGSTYQQLIQRLNDVSVAYITTDSSFNKYTSKSTIQIVKTEKEIMDILHDFDLKDTCILLEGRQPKKRLESIIIEV